MNLYEGMFLLDNQAVRADWRKAKSMVTDVLEKHGAKVTTARRWDERKLAYPIKGRQRGTYLLSYYELDNPGLDGLRRDLELSEQVLRYLLLRVDDVPEGEHALHAAELEAGFEVPPPPEDDVPDEPEARATESEDDGDEDEDAPKARGESGEDKDKAGDDDGASEEDEEEE